MDGFKQFSRTKKWSTEIKDLLKPYIDLDKYTGAYEKFDPEMNSKYEKCQLEIQKVKAELEMLKSKNKKAEEELKTLRDTGKS